MSTLQPPPPPPPPDPPDPNAPPRWPLWLPVAGLLSGLTAGFLGISVLSGILSASGVRDPAGSPGLTAAGTVIIDLCVVLGCLLFAGLVARPRPWHLGLRGAPLKPTLAIAGIGVLSFFLFSLVYSALVRPDEPQKVVDDLGADTNTVLLVAGALVVIAVAPICEELFFRAFLYRVLRIRMSVWFAAGIDGLVFGIVHASSTSLTALPILAFLGFVFCYVYERTGTLFATIALHALNNTISYGVATHNGWVASLVVGGVVIGGCVLGVMRAPQGVPQRAPVPA
jgi:membrane protease YdiL (CAAX protease family)